MLIVASEQNEQTIIAEAAALVGQVAQLAAKLGLRWSAGLITNHLPVGANDLTGPPRRQVHHGPQMRNGFALGDGPYVCCQEFPKGRYIQHLLGQQLLQLGILFFQGLQALRIGDAHAAILATSVENRRLADPVLAGETRALRAGLLLLQHSDDLFLASRRSRLQSVNRSRFIPSVLEGAGL